MIEYCENNMLENKVFIIIGSNGLIGKSLVKSILENKGKVLMSDLKNNKHSSLLKKFNKKNYLFHKVDITNEKSLDSLFKYCFTKYKKINGVINCAYPKSKKWGSSIGNINPKYLKEDLYNQLGSSIILSKISIKYFLKQKFGNYINISSIQGVQSPKFDHYIGTSMVSPVEYSAIKSGIIAITKYFAKYYKKQNIRFNCISPGGIKNKQPKKFLKKYKKDCGVKGMLDSDDLNGTLLYLLSDHSKYVTGQNIIIDDGWSL
tara:strand:- start:50 stop:832 length:783 start_codon:yes stop_codon:yes gene_type:complete